TSINEINYVLRNNNPQLALLSATVPDFIRAAGVVATRSHGAKTALSIMSDQVVSMKIVAADGKAYEFSLFGIIYSMTFCTEPMFNLHMIDTLPLAKDFFVPSVVKQLFESSDSLQIFYWPFNSFDEQLNSTKDKIWVKQWVRTDEKPTLSPEEFAAINVLEDNFSLLANIAYKIMFLNAENTPAITSMLWNEGPGSFSSNNILQAPDSIHFMSSLTKNLPMNLFGSTRALLAPNFDPDPNAIYCFIEMASYHFTPDFQTFVSPFEQKWIQNYNVKLHWAKEWEYVPNIKSYLYQAYKEQIVTFEKIREKYDLNKLFFDNESFARNFRWC
ncbi:4254_t:CDS:2, partial [Diversispora eburnea]